VAWTLQPAAKGVPPVDWSHWDPADPDKLLRLYDWGYYTREDENAVPYKVVDFVLDTQSGKTAGLPLANRGWSTQRDGRETIAMWGEEGDRVKYGLVANGYDGYDWVTDQNRFEAENILLVNLESTRMQVKDVMPDLRKRIDDLLSERRPDVAAKKFIVSYPIKAGDTEMSQNDFVEIPFEASPLNSNLKEFQLVGTVKFRISDGEVVGAFSDQKRLNPFIDNEALKKADEKLKSVFQALLKSLPPADAAALKQQELKWIVQRDSDAAQAVNLTPVDARQPDWEAVRETSLLESTKKRIEELQSPINRTTSPP
jgi:uncharacterized protein YecT (DUF1311 family)